MLEIKLEGLENLLKKASPVILATPMKNLFTRAAITVQGRARKNAPVDTGRLRASIAYEIDSADVPQWAKVGTNVQYAKPMEYGTGLLSDAPNSKGGRHYPPGGALDLWASRHGFDSGWAVASAIGRRGGLRPRRYLRNALSDPISDIQGFIQKAADEIRGAWDK